MGESYIQLPTDSSGKKVRTRQRTVGANTIEEQYIIVQNERVITGIYIGHTGAHVVQASAHATTGLAGFWWLTNPVGSSVSVALRRVEFMSQLGSALATPTSPRIVLERFAFTGTHTGTAIVAAKRATADATQVARLASATTGMTITGSAVGAQLFAFLPIAGATAVGYTAATAADWNPDDDGQTVLAAGEGIICRQADAGTTSDTRRFVTNIAWSEFTIP
jgi:hypothetical protein